MTANWPDPKVRDLVPAMLASMPFAGALGVEMVDISPGSTVLEAPLSPPFEAPKGAFAASSVGALGDMAAITSIATMLPAGTVLSTQDFTIKMLGSSRGERLRAIGRVLRIGGVNCIGAADVFVLNGEDASLCGTVLATGRRFEGGAG